MITKKEPLWLLFAVPRLYKKPTASFSACRRYILALYFFYFLQRQVSEGSDLCQGHAPFFHIASHFI